MLKDSEARATIAVKDLVRARQFYEGTLGLHANEGMGTLVFDSGKSKIVVYKSEFAGTNKATSATWQVPDAEKVVADLKAKGVKFEHYDLPGLERKGDIHMHGSFKGAWFKDPDGNILHVLST